jgi:hypothetical protein
MKELIVRLISMGYDIFIPLDNSDDIVVSSVISTRRLLYRPSSLDSNRCNYYIQNSSNIVSEASAKIDGVISYTPLGVFVVPIRDALNKRIIRINSDAYKMNSLSMSDIQETIVNNVKSAAREIDMAENTPSNDNYFESIVKES